MKMKLLFCSLVFFLLIMPSFAAAASKLPQGTLNRKAIKQLFSDRTVNSITAKKGRLAVTYYTKDGEVHQLRKGKLRAGHWRATKEGRLCLQIEGLREKCRIIVKEGDVYKKYIVRKDGAHQHTLTYLSFSKGNPYGL